MSWIKYAFSDWNKLVLLKVDYDLITTSGKSILQLRENYTPKEMDIKNNLIGECDRYGYMWDWIKLLGKDKVVYDYLNKRANELLTKYQKDFRNQLRYGVLDGGNYIVKCVWNLWIDTEPLSYDEYKRLVVKKCK
jgi:hypothetical protein